MSFNVPIDPALLAESESTVPHQITTGLGKYPHFANGRQTSVNLPLYLPDAGAPGPSPATGDQYSSMSHAALKGLCSSRGLKISGNKAALRARLIEYDQHHPTSPVLSTPEAPVHEIILPQVPKEAGAPPPAIDQLELESDVRSLDQSFQKGLQGDAEEEDDEDDEDEPPMDVQDTPATHAALEWVEKFIFDTRRKSGRDTERSAIKLWTAWASVALEEGVIKDFIIDAPHIIHYLKYAATRSLLTPSGKQRLSKNRLSASSLKKIMTMLGRVRRRQEDEDPRLSEARPYRTNQVNEYYKALMIQAQRLRLECEDFDVTKGTILESQLRPSQFNELTTAIFGLPQLPSVIKAHFCWSWQLGTLNRSDEVINLPMMCLQPYSMYLPDYIIRNGQPSPLHRQVPGVLALYYETKTAQPGKTEPLYSFVIPHQNPLRCSVGALAIMLHYMFDQENLISKIPGWNWGDITTWGRVKVLFGRHVNDPISPDGFVRMYRSFIDKTSIQSHKKGHLARKAMPAILQGMGIPSSQVNAVGHWSGDTQSEYYSSGPPKSATLGLAGFAVGETYNVPWSRIAVPDSLQTQVFPFCEAAIAQLRVEGCTNGGIFGFLDLLIYLRPFFWRVIAAISSATRTEYSESRIIAGLDILQSPEAKHFLAQWPSAVEMADKELSRTNESMSALIPDSATLQVVSSFHAKLDEQAAQIEAIHRRTAPMSPAKRIRQAAGTQPFHAPPLTYSSSAPHSHLSSLSAPPMSYQVSAPSLATSYSSTVFASSPSQAPPQSTPPSPTPTPTPTSTPGGNSMSEPGPSSASDQALRPISLVKAGKTYHILPVAPTPPGTPIIRTPQDLILPPPHAFPHGVYPSFSTQACSWSFVLGQVSNPVALWDIYAPKSLGAYPDLQTLWDTWDEGASENGIVGHGPPLRLVDERWGSLPNKETGKSKYAAWRPRQNANARKIWSSFYFFIQRIEALKASGYSSENAVKHFEDIRKSLNLNVYQFHKHLQVKKKRDTNNEADT